MSVGQICDANHNITFFSHHCEIRRNSSQKIIGKGTRSPGNVYVLDEIAGEKFSVGRSDNSWLWHKRPAHLNFDNWVKTGRTDAVRGMPRIPKPTNRLCGSCLHGKQVRTTFKPKIHQSTSQPLELVHTDLCGPARIQSLQGERYFMLFIDDYSRMI